ncbi:MAG: hypothetical protein V3V08_23525 [Nannocystaceae bacterium]
MEVKTLVRIPTRMDLGYSNDGVLELERLAAGSALRVRCKAEDAVMSFVISREELTQALTVLDIRNE